MPQPSFSAASGDARHPAAPLNANTPHAMPPKQAEYELPDVQGCGLLRSVKLRAKSALGLASGQVLYRTACSDVLTVRFLTVQTVTLPGKVTLLFRASWPVQQLSLSLFLDVL
jgi:hypothetical protein